jgi:hypothetical protein
VAKNLIVGVQCHARLLRQGAVFYSAQALSSDRQDSVVAQVRLLQTLLSSASIKQIAGSNPVLALMLHAAKVRLLLRKACRDLVRQQGGDGFGLPAPPNYPKGNDLAQSFMAIPGSRSHAFKSHRQYVVQGIQVILIELLPYLTLQKRLRQMSIVPQRISRPSTHNFVLLLCTV